MRLFKKTPLVLPLFVVAVMLMQCGGKNSGSAGADLPASDSVESANDIAFRLASENKPFEEYMPVQLRGVEELRHGTPTADPIAILSQTGHMYMRHGDYSEALEFLQEASDSLSGRDAAGMTPERSAIRLHGDLAGLYSRVGLYEDALEENALALSASDLLDHAYCADLWRMRGEIFRSMLEEKGVAGAADSVLYCLDMAAATIPLIPDEGFDEIYRVKTLTARADFFISHPSLYRDSIPASMRFLEAALPYNYPNRITQKTLLGRGYVLTGNSARGLSLMEEALADARGKGDRESVLWILELLAQSYDQTGNARKLADIYDTVEEYRDSLFNSAKVNAVVGADFRYRLREKQKQVEVLNERNRQARRIIIYEGVALCAGLLIGAVLMLLAMACRRKMMAEKREQKNIIDNILANQKILNTTIESLNERLEQEKSMNVVEKVEKTLDPELLSGSNENEFRRAFASLYPHFMPKLREDFPSLTDKDELLCMLIYLKVPAADMAVTLGITRSSLNSARYRIRKKIDLDKDADLDLFLQTR